MLDLFECQRLLLSHFILLEQPKKENVSFLMGHRGYFSISNCGFGLSIDIFDMLLHRYDFIHFICELTADTHISRVKLNVANVMMDIEIVSGLFVTNHYTSISSVKEEVC